MSSPVTMPSSLQQVDPDGDTPHDECGVVGIFTPGRPAAKLAFYALQSIQHRGQESGGIAASDGSHLIVQRDMGLVNRIFDEQKLAALPGHLAIGHVRYSTAGSSTWNNAQPVFLETEDGYGFALAHNGNLTNTKMLEVLSSPEACKCTSDSHLFAQLILDNFTGSMIETLAQQLPKVEGAFSLTIMDEKALYIARDRHGFRPLVIGRLPQGGWVFASETCALDILGAVKVRTVRPGELIVVSENGLQSRSFAKPNPRGCAFEYVYIARPDHHFDETSVYMARRRMGELLAKSNSTEADLVIPVPDSGCAAASGFSGISGIPYAEALQKNRYIGRTFIEPTQELRNLGIRMKLNPISDVIAGKRIIVVDDSIVRGNTSKQLVEMLRFAGAVEVHMKISSPPVAWPCYYGIDMATRAELIAANLTTQEIGDYIGVDSLEYLTVEDLVTSTKLPEEALCTACFTGNYPTDVADKNIKAGLQNLDEDMSNTDAFSFMSTTGQTANSVLSDHLLTDSLSL